MNMAQRIVAGIFAAFLWLIAFATIDGGGDGRLGLVALLCGMALVLWAIRPEKT